MVEDFCRDKNIQILLEIPYMRKIAELYSRAIPFVLEMPEWRNEFLALPDRVGELLAR